MKNKTYIFSFKNGGWNTVIATNIRTARKLAREEYKSDTLVPDLDTLRVIDDESYRQVLRVTFD